MGKAKRLITLCHRCKRDYQDAGYVARRDCSVTVKDVCEFCGYANGWTYYITEEKAIKSECEKCNRMGFDYILEDKHHANKTMR